MKKKIIKLFNFHFTLVSLMFLQSGNQNFPTQKKETEKHVLVLFGTFLKTHKERKETN